MKLMACSLTMLLLLLGFAKPVLAQNPALRMTQEPHKECVKSILKNLNTASALAVTFVELSVFDQNTCQKLCVFKKAINTTIHPCQSITRVICCPHTLPSAHGYIYWLRVHGTAGAFLTEDWLFVP
jgi:hypothetical protein